MIEHLNTQGKNGGGIPRKALRNGWRVSVAAMVFVLALALTACSSGTGAGAKQPAVQKDQDVILPVAEISETATFYPVEVDGTSLEIIAVKAGDGTIRTAFNTCQVCYDSGKGYYQQQGDALVCQNCGNQFSMSQVEVAAGGCNPWPIFADNKIVTADSITISYDFLKESTGIFSNWKGSY